MVMFDLASMLHKTVAEIEDMTVEEFIGWQHWWRVREAERKNRD